LTLPINGYSKKRNAVHTSTCLCASRPTTGNRNYLATCIQKQSQVHMCRGRSRHTYLWLTLPVAIPPGNPRPYPAYDSNFIPSSTFVHGRFSSTIPFRVLYVKLKWLHSYSVVHLISHKRLAIILSLPSWNSCLLPWGCTPTNASARPSRHA